MDMGKWKLLAEGGPIMPLILSVGLAGLVLAVERIIVWGLWGILDRGLHRAASRRELRQCLGRSPRGGVLTPLRQLLLAAAQSGNLPPLKREARLQPLILRFLPVVDTRIATIGWLGSILPLLGLLGTVSGMIATFGEMAQAASRQVLSQGLSEALWTTQVALLAALPLLAVHHGLTRLRERWLNHLERGIALLEQEPEGLQGMENAREESGHEA